MEFKIIGDLTLKQFFFLLIFCGLAYMSFMAVQPFIIKWFLVVFFVGIGLCFAFLPLGDRGLDVWIVNFLKAMLLPNQFVYRKQEEIPNVFLYQNLDVLRNELITLTPTSSRRKIEAYLEQQEVPVDKLDFDEKSYILKVREAYSSGYAGFSSSSVTASVIEAVTPSEPINVEETPQIVKPQVDATTPDKNAQVTTSTQIQNLTELKLPAPRSWQSQPVAVLATPTVKPTETRSATTPQVVQKIQPQQSQQENIIKSQIRAQASSKRYQQQRSPQVQGGYYSPTMTPDMHAGRRFINLTGETERGEIILPIRNERILKSFSNAQFEQDEAEKESQKVQQLDNLINQIKSKEVVQKQIIESQRIKETDEAKKRLLEEETRKAKQQEIINISEENKRTQEKARLEAERQKAEEERRLAEEKAREQAVKEQERLQGLRDQENLLK
ncbi:MAG: hypothetical protein WC834_02505, partial [Eubacteriales bacterium]